MTAGIRARKRECNVWPVRPIANKCPPGKMLADLLSKRTTPYNHPFDAYGGRRLRPSVPYFGQVVFRFTDAREMDQWARSDDQDQGECLASAATPRVAANGRKQRPKT